MSKLGSTKNLLIGPTCFCWRCCRRTLCLRDDEDCSGLFSLL